ncbi:MAG TPA: acetyl-CoA C-acyltransferase, partial [Nitrososphaerales archaeon]|nr:acetyl-CoA C-acyltransferase [Nitrososphaerales archaeon]
MAELKDAYVGDYLRVPFSRSRPSQPERDVYNSIRMDQALAMLIRKVLERTTFKPEEIGDVVTGCAFQTGENWLYGGRHPVLLAGLPVTVPAMAMDRACASSMNASAEGAMEIMTGNSDIVLAGGMEHLTHVPIANNPALAPNTRLLTRPEYMRYQMGTGYSMGLTAEKLAEQEKFTRDEMDRFSVGSHQKAARSVDEGWFRGELLEMKVEVSGEEKVIDADQSIRRDTTLEQLAALQPSFKAGGLITAGNSSPLNAGASMVALSSREKLDEHGVKPLAKVVSMGWAGVDPSVMGKGPVPASQKALSRAGIKPDDVDLWEINEAFAVV